MKKHFELLVLYYLRAAARLQLKKNKPRIIGITGSTGKSSACEAAQAILAKHCSLKVVYKANSESGIPLDILGIRPGSLSIFDWLRMLFLVIWKLITNWEKYDTYLVEMGIDSPLPPKNMEYLLTIVTPDIAVVLNAYPTHAETFDFLVTAKDIKSRKKEITRLIAIEKGKCITTLSKKGFAITNIDQAETSALLEHTQAKIISFGTQHEATVRFANYILEKSGTIFEFTHKGERISVKLPYALPEHYGYTFAAAICIGIACNISLKECCAHITQDYKPAPGRSSLIPGKNNSLIIDSSYNASTRPMLDMLDLLEKLPGKNKLAILGDMRELGIVAQQEHELVAKKAAEVCNQVLLVGPLMKKFVFPLLEEAGIAVSHHANGVEAAKTLLNKIDKETVVLVKGSQNTLLLENAVEVLMSHPEDAEKLLARRGQFWDLKRAALLQTNSQN